MELTIRDLWETHAIDPRILLIEDEAGDNLARVAARTRR